MTENIRIKTVQFKRGSKDNLERRLVAGDLGVPMAGEPIFEQDTGKLKIGDGSTAYANLKYIADARFVIQDPLSNQILFYDSAAASGEGAWVNRALADGESLEYSIERGLAIRGYDDAAVGYLPVKRANGIVWEDYSASLDAKVQQANTYAQAAAGHAVQAGAYETAAGNSAVEARGCVTEAAREANRAEYAVTEIKGFIDNKFW